MKMYVVSDIHGHATILKRALRKAGFDPQNSDHLLICCGDCFDRGKENRAVLEYLQSIPGKILIRGNHEDMLKRAMWRGSISSVDVRNGTTITIEEFFGEDSIDLNGNLTLDSKICDELEQFIHTMVDYFETEHYVFTHGWIPLHLDYSEYRMRKDWRTASWTAWQQARFTGWNQAYQQQMTLSDKTIICGHRGTYYGNLFDPARSPHCHDPFYGKQMIAIDGLTVVSGQVNVLVLEEEIPTPRHHRMTLPKEHFDHIAEGSKTIEMRLYDEKRRMIRVGDTIEFACDKDEAQKLLANVQGLYVYPNFERLVEEFTPAELGFAQASHEKIAEYMRGIYGEEAIIRGQALAIKVKVIDSNELGNATTDVI